MRGQRAQPRRWCGRGRHGTGHAGLLGARGVDGDPRFASHHPPAPGHEDQLLLSHAVTGNASLKGGRRPHPCRGRTAFGAGNGQAAETSGANSTRVPSAASSLARTSGSVVGSTSTAGWETVTSSTTRAPAIPAERAVSPWAHLPPYGVGVAPMTPNGLPTTAPAPIRTRDPVDRVVEDGRHGAVVLGGDGEDAVGGGDALAQGGGGGGCGLAVECPRCRTGPGRDPRRCRA